MTQESPMPERVMTDKDWTDPVAITGNFVKREPLDPTAVEPTEADIQKANRFIENRLTHLDLSNLRSMTIRSLNDSIAVGTHESSDYLNGLIGRIESEVHGIPCAGHEDFAAGTWTFHREGECPS